MLNLKASIAGETREYTDMYPGMAKTARQEGFDEIADPKIRDATLLALCGIEESVFLDLGRHRIKAIPAEYEERTTPEGKTSSMHWVRFAFTPDQIARFRRGGESIMVGIAHANYGHTAVMNNAVRAELAKDFA